MKESQGYWDSRLETHRQEFLPEKFISEDENFDIELALRRRPVTPERDLKPSGGI